MKNRQASEQERVPQSRSSTYAFYVRNISSTSKIRGDIAGHKGTVSSGGRRSTNLRFADNIDGLAGEEEEMAKLV